MRSRFMAMEAGRKANPGDFKAPTGAKPLSKGFTYVLSPYDNAMLACGPRKRRSSQSLRVTQSV